MAVALLGDIKDFDQKMNAATGKVDTFSSSVKKMGDSVTKYAKMAALAAAAAVTAFAVSAVKDFVSFDTGMREVFTLMPELSSEAKDAMMEDVLELSEAIATVPEEVIPALYQAISRGVPRENVFAFMEVAGKAAIGGVTTLQVAVEALTNVTNAYGESAESVERIADIMFTTVKKGATNFEEISERLFQAVPIAASVGLEFSNIAAMAAQITLSGVPMRVGMTQIRSLINEVAFEGKELNKVFQETAGMTFPEFIATGADAGDIMAVLEEAAARAGKSIAELTSNQEAQQALLNLSGDKLTSLNQLLLEYADNTGAYQEAYEEMAAGVQYELNQLKVWWDTLKLDIGGDLIESLRDLLGWIQDHKDEISEGVKKVFDVLQTALEWTIEHADAVKAALITIAIGLAAITLYTNPMKFMVAELVALVAFLTSLEGPTSVVVEEFKTLGGQIEYLRGLIDETDFSQVDMMVRKYQAGVRTAIEEMVRAGQVGGEILATLQDDFSAIEDSIADLPTEELLDAFLTGFDALLMKYAETYPELEKLTTGYVRVGEAIEETGDPMQMQKDALAEINRILDELHESQEQARKDQEALAVSLAFTTTEIEAAEKTLADLSAELAKTEEGSLDYIVVVEKLRSEYAKLIAAEEAVAGQGEEVGVRLAALIAKYEELGLALDKSADDVRVWGETYRDIISSTLADVLWDLGTFHRKAQDAEEDHQQRMQDIIEGAADRIEDINLGDQRRREDLQTSHNRKLEDIEEWYQEQVANGEANTHEKKLALDAQRQTKIEEVMKDHKRALEDLDKDYTRAIDDNEKDREQALADELEAYEETIPKIGDVVDNGIKGMVNSLLQSGIDKAADWVIGQLWNIAFEADAAATAANTSLAGIGTGLSLGSLALAAVPLAIGTSSAVAEGVASANTFLERLFGRLGLGSGKETGMIEVPTYAMGGIVPGPIGSPQPAIVHGGEPIGAAGFAEVLDYERLGNAVAAGVADAMDEYMGDGRPIIVQLPDGTKLAQALYPPLQKESQRRGGAIL